MAMHESWPAQELICLTMGDLPIFLYEPSQGGYCIGYPKYGSVGARSAIFFLRPAREIS